MNTLTFHSPIDGKPVIIQNPLLPEHIKVDQLIWYDGFTSTFSWSCPAIITRVNRKQKTFHVRSLDDMVEQSQEYKFSVEDDDSDSRKTMRLIETETVRQYLEKRGTDFLRSVENAREALRIEEEKATNFNEILLTLQL